MLSPSSSAARDDDLAATTSGLASKQSAATLPHVQRATEGREELKVDEDAVRQDIRESEPQGDARDVEDGLAGKEGEKVDADADAAADAQPSPPANEEDADTGEGGEDTPSSSSPPAVDPAPGASTSTRSPRFTRSPPPTSSSTRRPRPPSLLSIASPSKKAAPTMSAVTHVSQVDLDADEDEDDTASQASTSSSSPPEPSLKYQRLRGSIPDILKKDSASCLAVHSTFLVLGTHAGMIFVLDFTGHIVKAMRNHSASILDLSVDASSSGAGGGGGEFVGAASMDGHVSLSSLSTSENYSFDFRRPMRCVALEPGFARRTSSRAFLCGGMAGSVVLREKGWMGMGHSKESILHSGEGPVRAVRWSKGGLVAWANERGVRIFDFNTRTKLAFLPAPTGQGERLEMCRPHLWWRDDRHLVVGWADQIKLVNITEKRTTGSSGANPSANANANASLHVEVSKIFQLDCHISGVAPYGEDLLVLAYITESESESDEGSEDEEEEEEEEEEPRQRSSRDKGSRSRGRGRPLASPPELRIISPHTGEEKSSDVLTSLKGYDRLSAMDYQLVPSASLLRTAQSRLSKQPLSSVDSNSDSDSQSLWYILTPHEIVQARPRSTADHVTWLLERRKYQEALVAVETMGSSAAREAGFDTKSIGQAYLSYLVDERADYPRAARVSSKILGRDAERWEEWIFLFLERGRIADLVEWVPTDDPRLGAVVYDLILAHFLAEEGERGRLLHLVREWDPEIYSTEPLAIAMQDRLREGEWEDEKEGQRALLETLAELYVRNGQAGRSLPYYLRLKWPGVFDLIREHNLVLDIRDQAGELVEFEESLPRDSTGDGDGEGGDAKQEEKAPPTTSSSRTPRSISLLVDNLPSLPPARIVPQLNPHPAALHGYLSCLSTLDPHLAAPYADHLVTLHARFNPPALLPFLRSMSSHYSFSQAYATCQRHDLVPEMVFLLGRTGQNKEALNLILERLDDVQLAIGFAQEQDDPDLWEDLLRYAETRPVFVRGLLENVGGGGGGGAGVGGGRGVDPVRLIRRIATGMEIEGLRGALRKILGDYQLQSSLLEGCKGILEGEARQLERVRAEGQTRGVGVGVGTGRCLACGEGLTNKKQAGGTIRVEEQGRDEAERTTVVFLCRHAYHLSCLLPPANLPRRGATKPSPALGPAQVNTTTTQRKSARRAAVVMGGSGEGEKGLSEREAEGWGPAVRWAAQREAWEDKGRYAARLRVPIVRGKGKGCPACHGSSGAAEGMTTMLR